VIAARPIEGLPEIVRGADLAALLDAAAPNLGSGDVLVVSHKAVSKAQGATRALADVEPSADAVAITSELGLRDARVTQVVLDESAELVRSAPGVLICRTRHGFVCANAGVDSSNAPDGHVVVLPPDPDGAARSLRAGLPARPAVVIVDSFGRAWRHGQVDVAIGVAGLAPLDDWRGRHDRAGRELRGTWIAVADQVAAAADLARGGKDAGTPAVVVSGLQRFVTRDDGPGAVAMLRPRGEDLFS
jgi:coenzyme F420-0:L-glutamate ligase / coenzyme F420-1:gamma-L-glutamate ligase